MTDDDFRKLLQELADTKVVKLAGSYAEGMEVAPDSLGAKIGWTVSDIDFYVPARSIKRIIRILQSRGIPLNSIIVGQISTPRALGDPLPVPLEFSDLFPKVKTPFETREVFGVEFRTHRKSTRKTVTGRPQAS